MAKVRDVFKSFVNYLEGRGIARPLQFLLCLGLIQGLVYTFIVPPWWHNDEPPQFEYVWLIANRPDELKQGKIDEPMRRELAESMLKFGYYDFYVLQPDLTHKHPIYIGASQIENDPPGYYWFVAIALRLVKNTSFEFQNYVARFVSILIFLATITITWKIMDLIAGEGHLLQWMVTCFIVLLPGLTDTMTSINNDVGAVLVFSLFFWLGLLCLKHGLNLSRIIFLLLILVLGYFTKSTTYPIFGLALIVFLFSLFSDRKKLIPFAVTLAAGIILVCFMFRWGDSAFWYRLTDQPQPTRVLSNSAPFGDYVIRLDSKEPGNIGQFISPEQVRPYRKHTATVGAWMWASQPVVVQVPQLKYVTAEGSFYSDARTVELSQAPQFVSSTISIPSDAIKAWLSLFSGNENALVYYDGITFVANKFTFGEPKFDDPTLSSGTWNGLRFTNGARNPSAESGWVWLNPAGRRLLGKASNFMGLSQIFVSAVQDQAGVGWYFTASMHSLFESFWANPARAKVYLLGGNFSYNILEIVTLFGAIGVLVFICRNYTRIQWDIALFVLLSFVSVWGITLMRGGTGELMGLGLVPWARYGLPAVIPTALILCTGWYEILKWVAKFKHLTDLQCKRLFMAGMGAVDMFTILSILNYFYFKQDQAYAILFAGLLICLLVLAYGFGDVRDAPLPNIPSDA